MSKGKFTIEPTLDRILVKLKSKETETESGIIIPGNAEASDTEPERGVVVAIGPGLWDEDGDRAGVEFEPGDSVLLTRYAGARFKVDGMDHVLVREEDIIALLREE